MALWRSSTRQTIHLNSDKKVNSKPSNYSPGIGFGIHSLIIIPKYSLEKKYTHSNFSLGCVQFACGGGWGIRTLVGLRPNGFQDRLVMTASISLRVGDR